MNDDIIVGLSAFSVFRRILAFLSLAAVSACSVLEDRDGCPCRLTLDMTGVDEMVMADVSSGGSFHYNGIVDASQETLVLSVPRRGVSVNVLSGDEGYYLEGVGLMVPEGFECPPVWMYSSFVWTGGEAAGESVCLHKNYCGLTVRALGFVGEPFVFDVTGMVCGYGEDGAPVEGDFRCRIIPDSEGYCHVRLPRQKDESLRLHVVSGNRVLRTFSLGTFLVRSGYDWSAPDLSDAVIELDYADTTVDVRIGEWSATVDLDVLV
ncbi:MAG: hypothetical protein IK143_03060 [Bacteroidales bacterium]|nr:hypothetical protein [Bacteroidales bacterium]